MAFWDEITRSAQEEQGIQINEEQLIGKWRIIVVKDLPFSDQQLNGKILKVSQFEKIFFRPIHTIDYFGYEIIIYMGR